MKTEDVQKCWFSRSLDKNAVINQNTPMLYSLYNPKATEENQKNITFLWKTPFKNLALL